MLAVLAALVVLYMIVVLVMLVLSVVLNLLVMMVVVLVDEPALFCCDGFGSAGFVRSLLLCSSLQQPEQIELARCTVGIRLNGNGVVGGFAGVGNGGRGGDDYRAKDV
jgi:hypothetical protein